MTKHHQQFPHVSSPPGRIVRWRIRRRNGQPLMVETLTNGTQFRQSVTSAVLTGATAFGVWQEYFAGLGGFSEFLIQLEET